MVGNVNSNTASRFGNFDKQTERKQRNENRNESKTGNRSTPDKVELSAEAKAASQHQAVLSLSSSTSQIPGISDEDLARMKTDRAEGLTGLSTVNIPASQLRVLQYQVQMVRELKGTLPERGDLETELFNLANAFETVRERVSGDSNRHMNFLEDAFRGVIAGAFFRDAQFQLRTDIYIEAPEGRILNQESLNNNTQILSEFNNHARLFSDVFLASFRTQGIQEAFNLAWSAVQEKFSQLNSNGELFADEPYDPFEKLLEEYENSGTAGRTGKVDDIDDKEANIKLTAMKIARRISNGDNVPMQDHRFLAEYDPNLYKAALKASIVAENNDPEDYESLADELAAEENAKALRDAQNSGLESYNITENPVTPVIDSEV